MCGNILDDWFGFDPPPVAQPAPVKDPGLAAQEAAQEELKRKDRRRSRLSTIITGGLGDPSFGQNIGVPALSGVTYMGR